MMTMPLLSLLVSIPMLSGLAVFCLPQRARRHLALLSMLLSLGLAVVAVLGFEPAGARFQWLEQRAWVPSLNIEYLLGVDGLSVLFLPATALLFLGCLMVGWNAPLVRDDRVQLGFLLILQGLSTGVFCALDLILFFGFWELSLLPLYFLMQRGGAGEAGQAAATRYVLLMLAGGVPLLIAIVLLAGTGGSAGFSLPDLLAQSLPYPRQLTLFLLLLLAFGLKVPLVPLHTWLPQFALAGPGSLTATVLGLKFGVYGLLRIALPLAPQAAADLYWLLAGLGTVSVIYGAVGMLGHRNLRVALAYGSISHVGLVILGLASLSVDGVLGAVSLLLNFAVATGGSCLLLECLRLRTGTTDIDALGGMAQRMPILAGGFLVCGLAGIGMPGTSGFHGELLLIVATLMRHTGAGMAALFGLIIAAGAFLAWYRQAFFGPLIRPGLAATEDLLPRERWVLYALLGGIFLIGLYPAPWLDIVRPAAQAWVAGLAR